MRAGCIAFRLLRLPGGDPRRDRLRLPPTAATRSGRFFRPRRRSHRSPVARSVSLLPFKFRFIALFDNTPSRGGGARRAGVEWRNVAISHTRHGFAVPPSPRRGYSVRNYNGPINRNFSVFAEKSPPERAFLIIRTRWGWCSASARSPGTCPPDPSPPSSPASGRSWRGRHSRWRCRRGGGARSHRAHPRRWR